MANRSFSQDRYALEKAVVDLYAVITIGATGAPTLTRAKGVASVSRTSAGLYVLTLSDSYNLFLGYDIKPLVNGAPAAPFFNVKAQTVTSTKTVTFHCLAVDNSTPTDPASGEILYVHLALSNSGAL